MKSFIHNKKILVLIFSILVLTFFINVVYAYYTNNIEVNYKSKSGEMICNVEVDKNDSYVINGIPYVIVKVKNYVEDENSQKTITAVDVEYSLTIRNKADSPKIESGATGTYIWQKVDENDNQKFSDGISTYLENITTNTYSFDNKNAKEDIYKIFIKSSNTEEYEDIDFEVLLNSVQKNAEN